MRNSIGSGAMLFCAWPIRAGIFLTIHGAVLCALRAVYWLDEQLLDRVAV